MTHEEYKLKKEGLEKQHRIVVNSLNRECALSNNKYQVGDIVTDHIGSIKIESIGVEISFGSGIPTCTYAGLELKKDLTPTKKLTKRQVWQSNISES